MIAKSFTQCFVQQVSRSVISGGRFSRGFVHTRRNFRTIYFAAVRKFTVMNKGIAVANRVVDFNPKANAADFTYIADLAAGLTVKRRLA